MTAMMLWSAARTLSYTKGYLITINPRLNLVTLEREVSNHNSSCCDTKDEVGSRMQVITQPSKPNRQLLEPQ